MKIKKDIRYIKIICVTISDKKVFWIIVKPFLSGKKVLSKE